MNKDLATIIDLDKIASELVYRVGIPDFKNNDHLAILIEILKNFNWPKQGIQALIRNLILVSEATPTSQKKVKVYLQKGEEAPKDRKVKKGPRGGTYYDATSEEKAKIEKSRIQKPINNKSTIAPVDKTVQRQQKIITKEPIQKKNIDTKEEIITPEHIQRVQKALEKTKSTTSFLQNEPETQKIVNSFIGDVNVLLKTRNKDLAKKMVDKYKLEHNNENAKLGEKSKLYLRSVNLKYRKIFSGLEGNVASTTLAKILYDSGALSKKSKMSKKSMTANKIFTESEQLPIKKTDAGIQIGNITVKHAKNYDYNKLPQMFMNSQGLSKKEAIQKTKELKLRVERHNFIINNFSSIFSGANLNTLKVCPKCDVTTSEGRTFTKKTATDILLNKITELGGKDKTITEITKSLNALNNITDKDKYETELNDILFKISNNKSTTSTSADLTEIIDYLRLLNRDIIAYFPSESNFALGDILTFTDRQPTIKDILGAKNLSSIFVSLENRSVKKGTGGASSSENKIKLTKFKSKDTQTNLVKIVDIYDSLINKDNVTEADKLIRTLEQKYSSYLTEDDTYVKYIRGRDNWVADNSKKLHNKEVWKRYYQLGYMLQTIYNNDVSIQAFQNSKYNVRTKSVDHELSDGVNVVAKLEFTPSMIRTSTRKPLNKYGTRFHHVVNKY